MASLLDTVDGMVEALQPLIVEEPGLQVYGFMVANPTPPTVDMYPADVFQNGAGFGVGEKQVFFTVRARVSTADHDAGQQLLYRLMDTADPLSVEAALADVAVVGNDGEVSGFRAYANLATGAEWLGCEWRVSVFT